MGIITVSHNVHIQGKFTYRYILKTLYHGYIFKDTYSRQVYISLIGLLPEITYRSHRDEFFEAWC